MSFHFSFRNPGTHLDDFSRKVFADFNLVLFAPTVYRTWLPDCACFSDVFTICLFYLLNLPVWLRTLYANTNQTTQSS